MDKTEIRQTISATTLIGDKVRNRQGEDLGKIEDLMTDLESGCVAYAVLSFGGVLGTGDKLFAVPWEALSLDQRENVFIMNIDKQRLEQAPGFDKNNWPDFADPTWGSDIYRYYGYRAYWE